MSDQDFIHNMIQNENEDKKIGNFFIPPLLLHEIDDKLFEIPVLKWDFKFAGSTDYIDGIKPNDLSSSIMKGIDCFARSFICFRIMNTNDNTVSVQTVFQRYSTHKFPWVIASSSDYVLMQCGSVFSSNGTWSNNTQFKENLHKLMCNSASDENVYPEFPYILL